MDIIHLLSDSIANQIAAGEVVQRPASVVKELMENAIDAHATSVQLIVKEAGRNLIQVIDNGSGMSPTDARMSFERHATSKIRESDDLFSIKTMGFRGEALASIAAVAQVELKTRRADDELGTYIRIEGSDFKEQEHVQCPAGTNLQIKNLFFNVPARRNFLKGNPVEMKHILEEFQRIALAHPEISFSLFHNEIEIFNLPEAKLSKRIIDVFGKSYREQLANCQETTPFVSIQGYVGKPEAAKKSKGEQYFFVNKRFIKSSYLNHAVTGAFESTIPQGSFPFYVLFIEIDPSHIDINIHPTKTEIKFDDEKAVYAILRSAVRQAIGVYNLTPSIDFESDINFGNLTSSPIPFLQTPASKTAYSDFESRKQPSFPADKPNKENWQKLFEGVREMQEQRTVQEAPLTFSSKANSIHHEPPLVADEWHEANAIQIHNRFIISQVKSGIMVIHQMGAYERIFYEKYLKELTHKGGLSQQLLFPKTVSLSPVDFSVALEIMDLIQSLGFGVEEFGQNTFIINGVPADIIDEDEAGVFKAIIEQFRINENHQKMDKKENMARSMAKRFSHKFSKTLSKPEINGLINQLFETSMPSFTPDGKPVMTILSLSRLNELIFNAEGFKQ